MSDTSIVERLISTLCCSLYGLQACTPMKTP